MIFVIPKYYGRSKNSRLDTFLPPIIIVVILLFEKKNGEPTPPPRTSLKVFFFSHISGEVGTLGGGVWLIQLEAEK